MTVEEAMVRIEEPESKVITFHHRGYHSHGSMAFDIAEVVNPSTNKTQMRKILTYVARHPYDLDPECEKTFDLMIQSWIKYTFQSLYDEWCSMSKAFQDGYCDTKYGHTVNGRTVYYTPAEKKRINANNKRLYSSVVSSKHAYEKYKDRLSVWDEVKAKNPLPSYW